MSAKLSYCMLVHMGYDDLMMYLAMHYNLGKDKTDRVNSIATTSNVRNMIFNMPREEEEIRRECDFIETVVSKFVREKIIGSFNKNVKVKCDKLHIKPFNSFFPYEVGMSRNVVTQVIFETKEDLSRFKLKEPKLYYSLVERCER